jgi:hypothetical protein
MLKTQITRARRRQRAPRVSSVHGPCSRQAQQLRRPRVSLDRASSMECESNAECRMQRSADMGSSADGLGRIGSAGSRILIRPGIGRLSCARAPTGGLRRSVVKGLSRIFDLCAGLSLIRIPFGCPAAPCTRSSSAPRWPAAGIPPACGGGGGGGRGAAARRRGRGGRGGAVVAPAAERP